MPRSVTLKLIHKALVKLQQIVDRGGERQRANTMILLGNGRSLKEVAIDVGINIRTVGLTRMDWLRRGFDSLKDAVRCGAPRKISLDELIRLKDAATKEPLTSTALLAKHIEGGGQSVHVNTLKTRFRPCALTTCLMLISATWPLDGKRAWWRKTCKTAAGAFGWMPKS